MSIGQNSRNNYAGVVRVQNAAGFLVEKEHLDIRPTLVTTLFADNQQFSPSNSDNWSHVGWRKLGNGRYWWIIADFSGIIDPFTDLAPTIQNQYVTQLSQNIPAGTVTSITVSDPSQINMSTQLFVENLNPASPTNFTCAVLSVNQAAKTVQISPVNCPAPGIPFALSRVSKIVTKEVNLVCPSVNTAFFESLNFSNPLNVLVQ